MELFNELHNILVIVQRFVSFVGILIIVSGVFAALFQYFYYLFSGQLIDKSSKKTNSIRLSLGRVIILGLEFIVAADLIGTTTTPDYYSVGILACIVLIRTFLSFSINREIMSLSKET